LPGVFNWALEGLNRLLSQQKFTYSKKVDDMLSSYRKESDSVALFLDDNNYEKSVEQFKPQKELYSAYRNYCINMELLQKNRQ
jgi:putative DNA primase/helicase